MNSLMIIHPGEGGNLLTVGPENVVLASAKVSMHLTR